MTDCILCRIVAGEAPAHAVAEDDGMLAFLDHGQATESHTLVVPRAHAFDDRRSMLINRDWARIARIVTRPNVHPAAQGEDGVSAPIRRWFVAGGT
jgi:diadenosine tetraphosphate (Ap4A) HIT family hydrolase